MKINIFDAARSGNLKAVKACLEQSADVVIWNQYGFTPLHCAAMGCNTVPEPVILEIIELLLKAGSPVNLPAPDGRTALFLAAEFSATLAPIKRLVQAGGDPNIRSRHGHIVVSAMMPEVKQYLSELTGHPIPPPKKIWESIKLDKTAWRSAKIQIDKVFEELGKSGLIVLSAAGTTQEDAFSDCSEEFHARGGDQAGLLGFCFYTRPDLNRAKSSSQLFLGFWGAPDGQPEAMQRVGQLVVAAFRKHRFIVDWDHAGGTRPMIYLQNIGQAPDTAAELVDQVAPPPVRQSNPTPDDSGL